MSFEADHRIRILDSIELAMIVKLAPAALLLALARADANWTTCAAPPAGMLATACDGGATCCTHPFSVSGWGCCPLGTDAVCCGNGYTCCPAGAECRDSGDGYSVVTECVAPSGAASAGLQICKPGRALAFSTALPNCLVVGDSVSIGYTPHVAAALADACAVQHAPLDTSDGGAEETAYGEQCLDYFLAASDGTATPPDVVFFNWGLHNLVAPGGAVVPGQSGTTDDYLPHLRNITARLAQLRAAHGTRLVFGLTSPEMCDADLDATVRALNAQAQALMDASDVPTVDLHAAVVAACGAPPQTECLGEAGGGCPHYSSDGYAYIANTTVAPAIRAALERPPSRARS